MKKKTGTKKTTKKKVIKQKNVTAVNPPRLTAQDRKWMAEDDARTLERAEEVKTNPRRIKAAKIQAKQMAKEKEQELISMKKIAKT